MNQKRYFPLNLRRFRFLAALIMFGFATIASGGDASPLHTIAVETDNGKQSWTVELASDDESRSTGLMFRKTMARDAGMLFRFDQLQPVSMWMKNTFLPLDMVFLGSDGRIASIHYGAVPQSLDIISSRGPVRYVLEINAGGAKRAGLRSGQVMRHPWFAAGD